MGIKTRLKEMDFEPKSNIVDKQELKLLLYSIRLFFIHIVSVSFFERWHLK